MVGLSFSDWVLALSYAGLGFQWCQSCLQPSLPSNRCVPIGQFQGRPQVIVPHSRDLKLGSTRRVWREKGQWCSLEQGGKWRGHGTDRTVPQKQEVKINIKSKYIVSLWDVNKALWTESTSWPGSCNLTARIVTLEVRHPSWNPALLNDTGTGSLCPYFTSISNKRALGRGRGNSAHQRVGNTLRMHKFKCLTMGLVHRNCLKICMPLGGGLCSWEKGLEVSAAGVKGKAFLCRPPPGVQTPRDHSPYLFIFASQWYRQFSHLCKSSLACAHAWDTWLQLQCTVTRWVLEPNREGNSFLLKDPSDFLEVWL